MIASQKSVRFEEEDSRKRGFRLFRRKRVDNTTVVPNTNASDVRVSIPSDQYNKFTCSDTTELQTRSMVVHPRAKTKKEFKAKKEIVLEAPPSARQSAFGGPVRYDWIDIETTAALKVQAAYRRNKVMNDLERQGITTGAIRNRARRRMANSSTSFFDCCGYFNFNFADFSSHDREAHREYQKMMYQEKKKVAWEKEEELRFGFTKKWKANKDEKNKELEAIEVVD